MRIYGIKERGEVSGAVGCRKVAVCTPSKRTRKLSNQGCPCRKHWDFRHMSLMSLCPGNSYGGWLGELLPKRWKALGSVTLLKITMSYLRFKLIRIRPRAAGFHRRHPN